MSMEVRPKEGAPLSISRAHASKGSPTAAALSPALLEKMHAYWRAANYLSVGQIYLQDNPLLEIPLRLEHIKPRLLGHWGTTTGLNFIYVHLNRLIKENDLNMIYVIGPGHGGPGLVAHSYLEGSYTERYPAIERDRNGLHRLFRQFSWPYGVPSHVSPETPGSVSYTHLDVYKRQPLRTSQIPSSVSGQASSKCSRTPRCSVQPDSLGANPPSRA